MLGISNCVSIEAARLTSFGRDLELAAAKALREDWFEPKWTELFPLLLSR